MKNYLPFLLLCAGIFFILSACSKNSTSHTDLDPKEFQQHLLSENGVVLDVRTPEEYSEGHLSNAQNIDYKDENFEASLQRLDKNKPYFVYCKAGFRSARAASIMQKMGFTKVYNLNGGIDSWKDEGLPLEQ